MSSAIFVFLIFSIPSGVRISTFLSKSRSKYSVSSINFSPIGPVNSITKSISLSVRSAFLAIEPNMPIFLMPYSFERYGYRSRIISTAALSVDVFTDFSSRRLTIKLTGGAKRTPVRCNVRLDNTQEMAGHAVANPPYGSRHRRH